MIFLSSNFLVVAFICLTFSFESIICVTKQEKAQLKEKVLQMFDHAFSSYMKYAYPADELMPLSCKGRYRNKEHSRGDIDEVLGNYTLTLVDTLDTLALLGRIDEFETAVKNVIDTTHFDRDLVVSVFESNIRMLGGLIAGHVCLIHLKNTIYPNRFEWYKGELLEKAKDLGVRLLPAFNTSTGLPMSRINLKRGITPELLSSEKDKFTCTACAGTLLLEFVALSHLTGETVFEEKVMRTMDYIWEKRNRASDLVGTVINVNDGEWAVKDASIGAGIDSYYEYLFKGYILIGDETLLHRFNRHYDSIKKYMSLNMNDENEAGDGTCMKTVHMHMPNRQSKNYFDALLAFWPGLQVLKGDIKGAIKFHENLHQVVKKHDFLPEAVLFDHSVHWSNHPLRPEFLESTYYLYKATKDEYYLDIAKKIVEQLEKYSRVKCGYAAIADVKTKAHEDRMDSFVYAETFKYLYLMFAEDADLAFDINEFLFSTEAHLLPLDFREYINASISDTFSSKKTHNKNIIVEKTIETKSCPSLKLLFGDLASSGDDNQFNLSEITQSIRDSVSYTTQQSCQQAKMKMDALNYKSSNQQSKNVLLKAADFVAGRADHMEILKRMGIQIINMEDGRVQLVHKTSDANNYEDAELGILFMTEMLELSKQNNFLLKTTSNLLNEHQPLSVTLLSPSLSPIKYYLAGNAQFGYDMRAKLGVFGKLEMAEPIHACHDVKPNSLVNKIVISKRGSCMFVDKARNVQKSGAIGLIIIDDTPDSSYSTSSLFSMSGDGKNDVKIPCLFLFNTEGNQLMNNFNELKDLIAFMGENVTKYGEFKMHGIEKTLSFETDQLKSILYPQFNKETCKLSQHVRSVLFKSKRVKCHRDDHEQLAYFFDLFNQKASKPETAKSSKTIGLIRLETRVDNSKSLTIDLDPILKPLKSIESLQTDEVNNHDLAIKVHKMLYNFLSKSTNFLELNDSEKYSEMLYRYVESVLNLNPIGESKLFQLSSNDQVLFDKLASQIELKN